MTVRYECYDNAKELVTKDGWGGYSLADYILTDFKKEMVLNSTLCINRYISYTPLIRFQLLFFGWLSLIYLLVDKYLSGGSFG